MSLLHSDYSMLTASQVIAAAHTVESMFDLDTVIDSDEWAFLQNYMSRGFSISIGDIVEFVDTLAFLDAKDGNPWRRDQRHSHAVKLSTWLLDAVHGEIS